jgi:hypothetical protein
MHFVLCQFNTYDLFVSKLVLLVLLLYFNLYILILHYLLHILTVMWLLMKLWQKPSRLFMCILNVNIPIS